MTSTASLSERSKEIRRETLKLSKANGGYHYGGCFSATEILIALYDKVMTDDDRFILSKGHACWPYYVLLRERGFEPKLEGHPSLDVANGVHYTTGSEGRGLPGAVGMTMARKLQKIGGRVFVLLGDGECQEGTTWESLLMARQYKLDNLVAIVDWNGIQGSGYVRDILPIDGLDDVARVLGWSVSVIDGHSEEQLLAALQERVEGQPRLIVAHTVKGKGVSYMEDRPEWHANWPDPEHEAQAFEELA